MSIYAVNGKEPIAAWIPSLDTSGNGTTTLTDLIGSNNGTLFNMDAATDWVEDTSNGGVRALDFDGSNDFVRMSSGGVSWTNSQSYAISCWFKSRSIGSLQTLCGRETGNTGTFYINGSKLTVYTFNVNRFASTTLTSNVWYSVGFSFSSVTQEFSFYLNGAADGTGAAQTMNATSNLQFGGFDGATFPFNGLLDDLRFFNQTLDAADFAYLYNSGAGRGRVSSPVSSRRRRQSVSGGVL